MTKPLLSEERIRELLATRKVMTEVQVGRLTRHRGRRKQNRAFTESSEEVTAEGHRFRVYVQRADDNPLRFAIQLLYVDADGNEYRLLRVAGRTGPHTNELETTSRAESARIEDRFRVNRITERYQASEYAEDGFASPAGDRFSEFEGAWTYFCEEASVTWPTSQGRLL